MKFNYYLLAGKLAGGRGNGELPSRNPGSGLAAVSSWRREVTPDSISRYRHYQFSHHHRASVAKKRDLPCLLVAVLIAWAALIVQARCQDLPQAPEPQKTPTSFWLLTGAYSASILGDDLSTQRFERMGCVEAWNPGLYGHRPSNARFLAISFGLEAASVIPARRMVRAKSRIWKSLGYAGLAWQTEGRADAIGHNLNLTKKVCAQ